VSVSGVGRRCFDMGVVGGLYGEVGEGEVDGSVRQ
jgi:hypothetical protein